MIGAGLPRWCSGKESACRCRKCCFNPWVRKNPWRRKWQPTPVFITGKSHGQRSLAGYSPGGCKESDMTGHTQTHLDRCYVCQLYVAIADHLKYSSRSQKFTKTYQKSIDVLLRQLRVWSPVSLPDSAWLFLLFSMNPRIQVGEAMTISDPPIFLKVGILTICVETRCQTHLNARISLTQSNIVKSMVSGVGTDTPPLGRTSRSLYVTEQGASHWKL